MIEKTRFAAKLLFQFRIVINGNSNKMRMVEERIILFKDSSAGKAFEKAIQRGKSEEYNYINDDGNDVYFEFIGVSEMIHLGIEVNNDEVWYGVGQRLMPMENKEKLIPPKNILSAFVYEKKSKLGADSDN